MRIHRTFWSNDRMVTSDDGHYEREFSNIPALDNDIGQDFEDLGWDEQYSLFELAQFATESWDAFKTSISSYIK